MKKILIIILIISGLIGIFYWRYKSISWKVYTNEKYGYSIDYPIDWTVRNFPDTQTGAELRPINSPYKIESECIGIDARGTAENEYGVPFDEYVKKAAIIEIQNYEKLNSIESVTTANGLIGYKTTWVYKTMDGQEKISLPITYFENKKTIGTTAGQLKYKTVQVILDNKNCEETYNQILPTFKIISIK